MQPCKNGHCVSAQFFCDGGNDCGDWSDEFNCTRSTSGVELSTPCPTNSFHCKGHMCIPQSWVCDGSDDCLDGSDEHQCSTVGECKNGFKCGKECILNQWVCDGEQDCADGSDEKECGPDAQYHHSCLPEHGWFNCSINGVNKCIPIKRACDNFTDCDDHSDEGDRCSMNVCLNNTCTHECYPTPKGPVCSCPIGFQAKGINCEDVDECQLYPPMCSQNCVNLNGSFQCSCEMGYSLSSDNHTCIGDGPEPVLFITTVREIRSLSLRSKDYMMVRSGVTQAHSITADFDDRFIFWAEKSNDNAGIYKSTMNGGAYDIVVSLGIEVVEDLDIDWVGRNIYFVDSGKKHIAVCDMQGTICTVVISDGLNKPRAIAVQPQSRLFFWSDWGSHPHIGSAGMDGSDRKEIVNTDIVWPNGVAVDDTMNRVYWSDAKLNRIESSQFDGSDRRILQASVNHPHAIDVFENLIFWADPVDHEVYSCNKFTGKNQQIIMKEASLTPTGLYVHHPSKQLEMFNPCWHVVCSHLCLLSPTTNGHRCACPVGMALNSDNRTCSVTVRQSSIIIASFTEMLQVTHQQIGRDRVVHLPVRSNLENIGAVVYNPLGHSIVYTDLSRRAIYSMHMETYHETLLFENVGVVEGLDIDPYTGNLYWTEISQGLLVVASSDINDRLILARGLHSPTCIVLAPERGLMFVVEGRVSHVISVWRMDGSWHEELVQVHGMVSSMSFDRHNLYFSDSVRGTIDRVDIDTKEKMTLRSHLGSPIALQATSDAIYWLTSYSNRVNWISKQGDSRAIRGFNVDVASNAEVQFRKLALIDNFDFSADHHCFKNSAGCSHICAPTPDGSECMCPLGMELDNTEHICQPVDCRDDEWFKCNNDTCIPSQYRCDGIVDCTSGEDEKSCKNETPALGCTAKQFECRGGGCIDALYYCDGEFDCHDESDEPSSCPPATCGKSEFACANKRSCIPTGAICDGQRDCADGSDEANCTSAQLCSSSQFYCTQSKICVPNLWVCDGDADCEHGEDESECSTSRRPCPINYIRCSSHTECVPRITLCNGADECLHATDDQLCRHLNDTSNNVPVPGDVTCAPYQFSCYLGSSECIPSSLKCDCHFDCLFGEDEEGCPSSCDSGLFRCPEEMKYINISWVCDGFNDCLNGEDERQAACGTPKPIEASQPDAPSLDPEFFDLKCWDSQFQCQSKHCIELSYVCDGHPDCPDGTDEGRNCSASCQANGGCPHKCISTPEAPICECDVGYEAVDNGHQCVDQDECMLEDPCAQLCSNTKGSYRCSCAEGYALEFDHHTCKALEGKPIFIVSSTNHIDLIADGGEERRQLVYSNTTIKDITYVNEDSTLSWITNEGLYSMDTLTSSSTTVYSFSGITPSALAYDRYSGNYYVTVVTSTAPGLDKSAIRVVSPSLSAEKTIVEDNTLYTDIALDSTMGLMFWSEHTRPHSGRILRSSMDGTTSQWLHSVEKVVFPTGMTLDTIKRRIYWTDLRLYTISSCDYNGNGQRTILSNTYGPPLSVAFFEHKIVWSNVDQKEVGIFDLGSRSVERVEMERTGHVLVSHSVLEAKLSPSRPCASNECGNGLCLVKSSTTHTCTCPANSDVISVDPFRCTSSKADPTDRSAVLIDDKDMVSSSGVTVASILICLAILTILAILGWVYYRRWRRTIGSPLKFRFRNALGLTEESTAWEESCDYSDRKMLYPKSEDDSDPHIVVDHNENHRSALVVPSQPRQTDSAYASQQSLVKSTSAAEFPDHSQQQLLPVSYSMKDQLLACEL
uniref:Vitellogenin receptor n=1 Tax=Diaphanosoma celebensis TaxID=2184134 RepID=A0A6M3U1C9_9CRUS|nr:vitellogenin receptor [Diaphanosoma celebensis]